MGLIPSRRCGLHPLQDWNRSSLLWQLLNGVNRDAVALIASIKTKMKTEAAAPELAIGVLAWNEEEAITATLTSLFQQSLFAELDQRGARCEVFCVPNGCTDHTPAVAERFFRRVAAEHPAHRAFESRVVDLREKGKPNAWNQFVHHLSHRRARVLFVMDADILLTKPATLWNLYQTLLQHPEASVAVDQPLKDIVLKKRKTWRDRLSLATTRMNQADAGQLTGQLYGIRAEVARRIYLPRDLMVEDGFIKSLVCTDFLARPAEPGRIVQAPEAAHVFQAYASFGAILNNQKRQMIGQTLLHLLLDQELKRKNGWSRTELADELRKRDRRSPFWLKQLAGAHLRRTRFFWRLFPGIPTFRFRRLAKLRGGQKLTYLPAALAGFGVTMVSCWLAHRFLKRGFTNYWPDTRSPGLKELNVHLDASGAHRA